MVYRDQRSNKYKNEGKKTKVLKQKRPVGNERKPKEGKKIIKEREKEKERKKRRRERKKNIY